MKLSLRLLLCLLLSLSLFLTAESSVSMESTVKPLRKFFLPSQKILYADALSLAVSEEEEKEAIDRLSRT